MAELNFSAADIENKQNKVETIDPNAVSDEQYPSTAAVVKYVKDEIDADDKDESYANNSFANALKGTASGASVYVEDVSPIEHDVSLKLTSDSVTDFSGVSVVVSSAPVSSIEKNLDMDDTGMIDKWNHIVYENGNEEYILEVPYIPEIGCPDGMFDTVMNDRFIAFKRTDFADFSKVVLEGKAEAWANYENGSGRKQFYFPINNFSIGQQIDGIYTFINGDFTIPETIDGYTYGDNGWFASYRINEFRIKLIASGNDEAADAVVVSPTADGTVEGVKSLYPAMAITTDTNGVTVELGYNKDINTHELEIQSASNAEIDNKGSYHKPIVPRNLDYAVKVGLTTNAETLTDEEKEAACDWLGAFGANQYLKTIKPNEDGTYFCNLSEMEDGMYLLPEGTKIQYRATGTTKTVAGFTYAFIGTRSDDTKFCYSFEDKHISATAWGGESIGINIPNVPNAAKDSQIISASWTFTGTPKVTGALVEDDNSTKIPNTQWVNSAIDRKIADSKAWRTIRDFTIENEETIANDTESGITWTVDDSGNITAFEFDTDADKKPLSANRLRYIIYPPNKKASTFGGKRGYLGVCCNELNGSIYSATNTAAGWMVQGVIEPNMAGILAQVTYLGTDRNSYGNERPHLNFFTDPVKGQAIPPITKFKINCDTGIWFVQGTKVLVQICEEAE